MIKLKDVKRENGSFFLKQEEWPAMHKRLGSAGLTQPDNYVVRNLEIICEDGEILTHLTFNTRDDYKKMIGIETEANNAVRPVSWQFKEIAEMVSPCTLRTLRNMVLGNPESADHVKYINAKLAEMGQEILSNG